MPVIDFFFCRKRKKENKTLTIAKERSVGIYIHTRHSKKHLKYPMSVGVVTNTGCKRTYLSMSLEVVSRTEVNDNNGDQCCTQENPATPA